MFYKAMSLKSVLFFSSLSILMSMNMKKTIEMKLINSESNFLSFSLTMDELSLSFISMVSMVTWAVLSYSNIYMEYYNKKKFFFLMMSFFMSMMILVTSNSIITTLTGWDGLGITSITLIMMYQNFNTSSNSILTMFFNRIGDLTLFISISEMMEPMFNELNENKNIFTNTTLAMFIIITAMTKSAQVPLSAWLPAAMSAPTPISAMVHSSTLVTAGIYLIMKMQEILHLFMEKLSYISSITLILASVAANTENDLKKIIAYSTMSQISIIMLMSSVVGKNLATAHMFNHAIFKTLTFMTAGKIFLENWSNQENRKIKASSTKFTKYSMNVSMISMSGLPFSSSFFSKDKFLESIMWENKSKSVIITLFTASIATIFYCKKIMSAFSNKSIKTYSSKKSSANSFFIMSVISSTSGSFNYWMMEFFKEAVISYKEVSSISTILLASSMKKIKLESKKTIMWGNNNLFMKWWSSNYLYNPMISSKMVEMSDQFMTSSKMWSFNSTLNMKKYYFQMSLMLMLLILISSNF